MRKATLKAAFPLSGAASARALGDTTDLVKFLADAKTDQVRGSSEDIGMICHAHPSLSEAVKEAALAVDKEAVNI